MNRRTFINTSLFGLAASATGLAARPLKSLTQSQPSSTPIPTAPLLESIAPALLERAKMALEQHRSSLLHTDVIGIADYSLHSAQPRFHLIDLEAGQATSLLVAHGKGSDKRHTGWLQNFSNIPGSEASSGGSYVTTETYIGKHGTSRRLKGLDTSNDLAEARAIVIHGAWYADPEMVKAHGKLGRSQGCFAFSETDLGYVLERLGPGRLLFADKA